MDTEKPKELTEEELMIEALRRLNKHEDFKVWRDSVAKPLINQWENELAKADDLTEVILRAKLYQLNTLKALFYTWFENIK